MPDDNEPIRVLYSFPHKIGADRICTIAWYQVAGAAEAGAAMDVQTGAVHKGLPRGIPVRTTLAKGRVRIPYRILGRMRALELHDRIVARRLPRIASQIDVIHVWPLGARHTLLAASELGIPTVLERPNAHTRFAYDVVRAESERIGVTLPPDHEHAHNPEILAREEEEYRLADYLLCPSEFVVSTFLDAGFSQEQLLRHIYGYDPQVFLPGSQSSSVPGLRVLIVGVAAVRKGQHLALEAWLRSSASTSGTLRIAGGFLPEYRAKLEPLLSHPSVEVLGHRDDVPELMRESDILVLPSLEEGFGLVCVEAMGSGCVPLVSGACTDLCRHLENSLVHHVGDVETLASQLTLLHKDRALLDRLRFGSLATAPSVTWSSAGRVLLDAYRHAVKHGPRTRDLLEAAPIPRSP